MKQVLMFLTVYLFFMVGSGFAQSTLDVTASDGNINEVIGADTLSDGTQAHAVYRLTTLNKTYTFTGPILAKSDIKIMGVVDASTGRPPCVQPAVLSDFTIPATFLIVSKAGAKATLENVYLLAYATDNSVNADGVAISVTADNVRLTVDNCVFDGWQTFGIGYNGNWCDFFINNNTFRNFVHPNQHYIGEVIRNTWPGEAYTDTLSMVGNTMLCVNGYAAGPVTKYYETFFEFSDNNVLYTFKNPFFIFNATNAKINGNLFYGNYAGGVDETENPWWDNLWNPDSSYGVVALEPLNEANAKIFNPADSANANFLAIAEAKRTIEVKNNTYFWPSALTDFWSNWNSTQSNHIITPNFMNERTVAMFGDSTQWPGLDESNNVSADPGFMASMDGDILNGSTADGSIGLLAYFEQIRLGTAAVDYWGYGYTNVSGDANWVPAWPLPESQYVTAIEKGAQTLRTPKKFELQQNYPNPFNPSTNITFSLNKSERVSLNVYNIQGQLVRHVVNNSLKSAGTYNINVDMSGFSSGIYYYKLTSGQQSSVKKMTLIK